MRDTTHTQDAIVRAAAGLLENNGREAITTRSVAIAAGVQVPTIYRHFGDMRGLLDAVISYELDLYLQSRKLKEQSDDPIEQLRAGWDCNVEFGLKYPAFYALMYSDPQPDVSFTATSQTVAFLHELVQHVAEAGCLRIDVTHATQMVHAACCGLILTLLDRKPEQRDLTLSTLMREAILDAVLMPLETITTVAATTTAHVAHSRVAHRAVALKAVLPEATKLTRCEQGLLSEWLDTLSQTDP